MSTTDETTTAAAAPAAQPLPETKTVPQLNSAGFFLGATLAYASPLQPGHYPLPALAVDAPLPRALGAMECARYNADADTADPWDYLPDYSAQVAYSVATGERVGVPPGWSLEEAKATLQAPGAADPAPQAATLEDLRAELQRSAAAMRWAVETGGITVAGVMVATTLADQNRITSVVANAAAAGVDAVDFKAASGWVSLTLPQLQAIAGAIARHVQRCYSAERAHAEAIALLDTLDAARAYDLATGWPHATAEAAAPVSAPESQPTTEQQEPQE